VSCIRYNGTSWSGDRLSNRLSNPMTLCGAPPWRPTRAQTRCHSLQASRHRRRALATGNRGRSQSSQWRCHSRRERLQSQASLMGARLEQTNHVNIRNQIFSLCYSDYSVNIRSISYCMFHSSSEVIFHVWNHNQNTILHDLLEFVYDYVLLNH
jgi:hypothetical protein